ncbi:hypothetical protein G3M48_009711 [Beauveria asiatica]|uniref:NYN domain-containing protein n=1 Tax=Beauveria asiatica TaxID=1069075 RepID=A0AAW0RI82_9HYPO
MIGDLPYHDDKGAKLRTHDGGLSKPTTPLQPRPQSCPKLGDFASLRSATMDFHPPHHILSHQLPSIDGTRLGDLSKIINQLQASNSAPKQEYDTTSPASNIFTHPTSYTSTQLLSVSDSEGCTSFRTGNASAKETSEASLHRSLTAVEHRSRHIGLQRQQNPTSQLTRIQTLDLADKTLQLPIFDAARTVEGAHQSLTRNIIPYSTADGYLTRKFPLNSLHGVHIFLDMSNIEIGFQKALKKKCRIADSARFSPLPRLNLQFLTELLVRGRFSRGLHVGCSILPGRKEPRYVQDLRELGYQVDVRERKCVENSSLNAPRVKFLSATGSRSVCRYVEDLVDETLQTRIAEAVMEHFQEQGTIVLATGDAKPAQYSDGFFRYVERALRMGWNVELVAWRGSLSSSWTNTDWTATWNDRFRIIELDSFIYDLLKV